MAGLLRTHATSTCAFSCKPQPCRYQEARCDMIISAKTRIRDSERITQAGDPAPQRPCREYSPTALTSTAGLLLLTAAAVSVSMQAQTGAFGDNQVVRQKVVPNQAPRTPTNAQIS